MGVIAMMGAIAFLWRFVSTRAALTLAGLLVIGLLSYWSRTDASRQCDGRAWFCDLIPTPTIVEGPPPCPEVEPITTRIFESDGANAEVHRLIETGVCQEDAINNVAEGWKAPFAPEYGSWWRRLFF
ncbi:MULTISPECIES: hypothetical protein [unclassified Cupriavidus]|uniref:hypothetical protein n=1 Tax=unclassified Cupriavidus TaxID=2640874 RepID=UPI000F91A00F|nr:hypothetical protein [Cupriavidus sp.]